MVTAGDGILRVYDSYTNSKARLCLENASDNLFPLERVFHWQKLRTRAWEKKKGRKEGDRRWRGEEDTEGRREESGREGRRSYWTASAHHHPRPEPNKVFHQTTSALRGEWQWPPGIQSVASRKSEISFNLKNKCELWVLLHIHWFCNQVGLYGVFPEQDSPHVLHKIVTEPNWGPLVLTQ